MSVYTLGMNETHTDMAILWGKSIRQAELWPVHLWLGSECQNEREAKGKRAEAFLEAIIH